MTDGARNPHTGAELLVDQRGQRCPLPVIELARRITEVPVGGVVRLLADDPAAPTDIRAWCQMRGHAVIEGSAGEASDTSTIRVRRLV